MPSFSFASTSIKTPKKVIVKVEKPKIKILIVPGHDDEVWGTQYGKIKEADMNLSLGNELYNILKKDKRFEVYITRRWGGYTKEFDEYLTNNKEEINDWRTEKKKINQEKIVSGELVNSPQEVHHVNANQHTSDVLYGINKWANDNKMDLVLHIHFNDYPRDTKWEVGKYRGIAMYVPDSQMANALESKNVAQRIWDKLRTKYVASDYPKEVNGIIPDPGLIAVGTKETLDAGVRSVLVEYGYIYGKIFRKSSTRHKAYKDMARLTAKGIEKYFFK